MPSIHTIYPSSVPDTTARRRDRVDEPRRHQQQLQQQQQQQYQLHIQQHLIHGAPSTPSQNSHLSAYPSPQQQYSTSSPALTVNTPAESESTLSVHYQSSEFSEADDPFFGASFNTIGGSPSFLADDSLDFLVDHQPSQPNISTSSQHVPQAGAVTFPLSPDKTPSLSTTSPNDGKGEFATFPDMSQPSIGPHELSLTQSSSEFDLTPKTSNSEESSENGLAPAAPIMHSHSPRVTVSYWEQDNNARSYEPNGNQQAIHDVEPSPTVRDHSGRWSNQSTGPGGLDPAHRPDVEVPSMNELASDRDRVQQNKRVGSWLQKHTAGKTPPDFELPVQPQDAHTNVPDREIEARAETKNVPKPGQTYYNEDAAGGLTEQDVEFIRQHRNWADGPMLSSISSTRHQPETAQAAIAKHMRMCDNESVVSRAATWGTRRRSLPSIFDYDVQQATNLFKKLSMSRGDSSRRPSIIGVMRDKLTRKPSVNNSKRSRLDNDDVSSGGTDTSFERRDSQVKLAPPSPTPWNRKNSVPSINTAFVAMGSSVAAIGTAHARSGSLSATPVHSPVVRSPSTLSVRKPFINRLRSKSENQAPGIVDMWKKTGGPPVSNLGNAKSNAGDLDDDDDEEDDGFEESDKTESDKLIDDITPNLAGFKDHVLKLNPQLKQTNNYLVERIAYQQIIRYKGLLNSRVKHIQAVNARNCNCGSMCIALGGSANILNSSGDARGADPFSARFDGSDGDVTPLEGAINQESFPQDIPMPPTSTLPAEFECQLCFQAKKFQKPSDWTKHVHEDVQPFTCTWDRCRDPKIFKRKADWVRHENEGHRHLEWWTCDVEDCRHVCYRRDNFLQHLVREHKFAEPKVKTKAAIKRAGGNDPTWQRVEACHKETDALPQHEPCRFCGKTFPTWKKLTVHLAKHMEQISLPILKLVAKKDLDEDTIISPVQDPPPRQFPPTFNTQNQWDRSTVGPQGAMVRQQGPMPAYTNAPLPGQFVYHHAVPQQQQFYTHHPNGFDDLTHSMNQANLNMQPVGHLPVTGFNTLNTPAYGGGLPVTTSPYMTTPPNNFVSTPEMEPFPAMPAMSINALGLQDPNAGVQMGYSGNMLDVHTTGAEHQFTPQGSVSPFSHSPHQPQGPFYHPQ
ncbi:hypothetical protein QBC40DRAFT_9640 [Triangularia verruculosa]|uniref:C2H2-type domain-containing protein n=1 Tax=Triangularia verruculosa TaxID=2587418 RepID=A0AAN6XB67_9PEZI|nr:hypothetical protein QBC40DRAFT_9640 [Triangularia verruculosa]